MHMTNDPAPHHPAPRARPTGVLFALLVAGCIGHVAIAAKPSQDQGKSGDAAEYAFRWSPVAGGPRTLEDIVSTLGQRDGKRTSFVVRYYAVAAPPGAAPHYSAIGRERDSAGGTQSTFKLRGATPLPTDGPLASWQCPFADPTQDKREVDIGWNAAGMPTRTWSHSCDADGHLAQLLPARVVTGPAGCSSDVVRLTIKQLKIERWTLPGGAVTFEVSSKGRDRAADLQAFERKVVAPLQAAGAKPMGSSKTETATRC